MITQVIAITPADVIGMLLQGHEEWSRRRGHSRELLLIQLRCVIDVDRSHGGGVLQVYWRDMAGYAAVTRSSLQWKFGR